jgi:hypothetical protein
MVDHHRVAEPTFDAGEYDNPRFGSLDLLAIPTVDVYAGV